MAGQVQPVLDGERDAGQRAEGIAGRPGPVDLGGGGPSLVGHHEDGGVQPTVHLVDAVQVGVDHLVGRHLAAGHQSGQVGPGSTPELVGHRGNLATT